jgi:hypothetical protein
MTAPGFTEKGLPKGLVLFATILAALFTTLGFITFISSWGSAADAVGDDVWLQMHFVGQGALPYLIAGGVFWLVAEYKTVHGAA